MKTITALTAAYFSSARSAGGNLRVLVRLVALLFALVLIYSITFHLLMAREGQDHSWLTGFYWTMVAMSTLGFGDVTFHSDLGRMFSVLVVVSGTLFMLVLLPFTFIQFFYAPWLEARDAARAPRELPASTNGHVLMTAHGPVDAALISRLDQFKMPYAVIVPEVAAALALVDDGVRVMVGDLDDPATYRQARVEQAALVVATLSDPVNANIAATVRECTTAVPIVALASLPASADILELAGCREVIQLSELLGQFMARRVFGRDGRSHPIGQLDEIVVAEAAAAGTSLVGRSLRDLRLGPTLNVVVAGVWERGRYVPGRAETIVTKDTVLLLAGERRDLEKYNDTFALSSGTQTFVVIIGGGRVGRAAARALAARGVEYCVVEKIAGRVRDGSRVVVGDAADLEILKEAGIDRASSVIVTTHEDDVNVYLTLYFRRLHPGMLILSRATLERNATTLHRVGADFVLSYASMGANTIFNGLRRGRVLFVAEGLDVFTAKVPGSLAGRSLAEAGIRRETGVNVMAVRHEGRSSIQVDVQAPLPADAELILIGDREAEGRFFAKYG
jgi:Trk K+ transport system NAD-binding subunit